MKRRLSFFSMIALVGVVMFALSSCTKDIKKDIETLQDEMKKVQSDINELRSLIGNPVTNVTLSGETVTVTFGNGSTSTFKVATTTGNLPKFKDNEDGTVTIQIWDADAGVYESFKFPKAENYSGGALIDLKLLGWIWDYQDDESISAYGSGAGNYLNSYSDIEFDYAWLSKIQEKNGWNFTADKDVPWVAGSTGGKYTVVKNQIVTDISDYSLLVEVNPATIDASKLEFALQRADLNTGSFDFNAAKQVTLPMTRAASGSALWILPLKDKGDTYASVAKFEELYQDNNGDEYVWAVANDELVSLYTLSFYSDQFGAAAQNYVIEVGGNAPVSGSTGVTDEPIFEITVGKDYDLTFNPAGDYVYDYYVVAQDPAVADMFGFQVNKLAGTFRATKNPDPITPASMKVDVFALQLDGAANAAYVGKTVIELKILPAPLAHTVYNIGNVIIEDAVSSATAVWPTGLVGKIPSIMLSLDDMFADLGADAAAWKSTTIGANLGAGNFDIEMENNLGDVYGTFFDAAIPAEIDFLSGATGTTVTTSPATAARIRISLPYSDGGDDDAGGPGLGAGTADIDAGVALPIFEVGKLHTITLSFYNITSNVLLNTVEVNFTPILPDFSDIMVRVPEFWKGDVLYGYFKESTPLSTLQAWKDPKYNITTDGGFSQIGSSLTKRYLGISLDTDPDQGTGANNVRRSIQAIDDNSHAATDVLPIPLAGLAPHNAETVQWGMGVFSATATYDERYHDAPGSVIRANNRFYGDNAGAPINIVVSALTKYLKVYDVDFDGELDFQLRLASATEQGTIEAATKVAGEPMLVVPYTGTTVSKIFASDFVAKNYNKQAYGIFPVWNEGLGGGAYDYTYIRSVSVSVPASEVSKGYYTIVDVDGNLISEPVAPDADNLSYIGVRPGNLSATTDTYITITVTDVFGFVKDFNVPMRFTEVP